MVQMSVAVVLPTQWSDFNDGRAPIMPTELREALDEVEQAHPGFEVQGEFSGTFEERTSPVYPRLIIDETGQIALYSSGVSRLEPGQRTGENLDRVREAGLPGTINRVLSAYRRKYHG